MHEIDNLSYRATLMSRDIPVGDIHSHRVEPIRQELLPLYFQRGGDFGVWLSQRAIDSHRTYSRLLKKVLRLKERDDISTALHFNAVTITDTYWVKPVNSMLTWNDVRFQNNEFDTLALSGDLSAFGKKPSRTPELTNTGSFEKCWRRENGHWWLYKEASPLSRFSELFICELCKALGFPVAHYERAGENIKSLDFTDGKLNFESAFAIVGEDEDYVTNYHTFQKFGKEVSDQYLELLLMDTFCRNADRHTQNYGVLRSPDTGAVLRMAPNFDNNIALVSTGYEGTPRGKDLFGELLSELEASEHAIEDYATRHPLPNITPELIADCCAKTGEAVDVPYIQQFVMAGYQQTPLPRLLEKQSVHQLCAKAKKMAAEINSGKTPADPVSTLEQSKT